MAKKNKIILSVIALTLVLLLAFLFVPLKFKDIINLNHNECEMFYASMAVTGGGIDSDILKIEKDKEEILKILNEYSFVRHITSSPLSSDFINIHTQGQFLYIDDGSKLHIGKQTFQAIRKDSKSLFEELMELSPFE